MQTHPRSLRSHLQPNANDLRTQAAGIVDGQFAASGFATARHHPPRPAPITRWDQRVEGVRERGREVYVSQLTQKVWQTGGIVSCARWNLLTIPERERLVRQGIPHVVALRGLAPSLALVQDFCAKHPHFVATSVVPAGQTGTPPTPSSTPPSTTTETTSPGTSPPGTIPTTVLSTTPPAPVHRRWVVPVLSSAALVAALAIFYHEMHGRTRAG